MAAVQYWLFHDFSIYSTAIRSILPDPRFPHAAVDFRNINQTLFLLFCQLPVFVMPSPTLSSSSFCTASSERLDPTLPRVASSVLSPVQIGITSSPSAFRSDLPLVSFKCLSFHVTRTLYIRRHDSPHFHLFIFITRLSCSFLSTILSRQETANQDWHLLMATVSASHFML